MDPRKGGGRLVFFVVVVSDLDFKVLSIVDILGRGSRNYQRHSEGKLRVLCAGGTINHVIPDIIQK